MALTTLAICICYKEKENAFMRNCKYGLFSLVFVLILGGPMPRSFQCDLRRQTRGQGHEGLTEFISMYYCIPNNTDRMLKFDWLRAGPYACVQTGVWTG